MVRNIITEMRNINTVMRNIYIAEGFVSQIFSELAYSPVQILYLPITVILNSKNTHHYSQFYSLWLMTYV